MASNDSILQTGYSQNGEEEISLFFRNKGLRWTPQRQLILAALQKYQGHVSAEDIHQEVTRQFPGVNLSTVYRTLETLCEMGVMVKVFNKNGDRDYFELVGEKPHHHLHCQGCGMVLELEEAVIQRLKAQILEEYSFSLELNHFMGYGLCRGCQARLLRPDEAQSRPE